MRVSYGESQLSAKKPESGLGRVSRGCAGTEGWRGQEGWRGREGGGDWGRGQVEAAEVQFLVAFVGLLLFPLPGIPLLSLLGHSVCPVAHHKAISSSKSCFDPPN